MGVAYFTNSANGLLILSLIDSESFRSNPESPSWTGGQSEANCLPGKSWFGRLGSRLSLTSCPRGLDQSLAAPSSMPGRTRSFLGRHIGCPFQILLNEKVLRHDGGCLGGQQ